MAFCTSCGNQLPHGSRFCPFCGAAVNPDSFVERKIVYEGVIHKCPNCGQVLSSFTASCPACGYEIRKAQASDSIKSFYYNLGRTNNPKEKAGIIRNFPIPNTYEDIVEFMILASSNVSGEHETTVFNAWIAKIEQCYQKAKISFENKPGFDRIQSIYDQSNKTIVKERITRLTSVGGRTISNFFKSTPNLIFLIIAVLICVYEISRIMKGDIIPLDFIIPALILWGTYRITNKKEKE